MLVSTKSSDCVWDSGHAAFMHMAAWVVAGPVLILESDKVSLQPFKPWVGGLGTTFVYASYL